ncbi:hypothetical protein ACOSQ3_006527 [Xanthoceras sorbifolium]
MLHGEKRLQIFLIYGPRKLICIQQIKTVSRCLLETKWTRKVIRVVTKKEEINFARESGCPYIGCSAKTHVNIQQCFEELVLKILDTRSLIAEGSKGVKKNIFKQKPQADASTSGCC